VSADRCFATVMLDEELWKSLVAIGGQHRAAWVHGCVLEHGHGGEHRALAYRAGVQVYWVQWGESRKPRLNTAVESAPPGQNARPPVEPSDRPRQAPPPTIAPAFPASPSEQLDSPKSMSQADALWAIAAALERLADVIAAAFNSTENQGRHSGGGSSDRT
jgi:hypothetical protein